MYTNQETLDGYSRAFSYSYGIVTVRTNKIV
jgi:hypothetical protein